MDNNIGIGIIVGATVGTSMYVYVSSVFSKNQKILLLVCFVFPPLQWLLIILLLLFNKYLANNSETIENEKRIDNYDNNIKSLKELRDSKILTEEEYNAKVNNLENSKFESHLKISEDYNKLKRLYEDGILTQQEFDKKIDILRTNQKKYSVVKDKHLIGTWRNESYEVIFFGKKSI